MKPWKIVVYPLLAVLAIGGTYLFVVFKHRQNPGIAGRQTESAPVDQDDLAEVRSLMPTEFKDVQRLEGATVWMKTGYVIPYFAFSGGHVQFAKRVGVLPSVQRMEIRKIVKAAVPAGVDDGISHGARQAFAVFALPASAGLYATPIGVMEGSQEAYFIDLLFFYDDPHTIYNDWPKEVWIAIDAHQAKPGMNELQTRLALGQKLQTDGGSAGNRTITYDQAGKPWTVTFVHGRAMAIK